MKLTIGIVGPEDLVDRVIAIGPGQLSARLVGLPYRHETAASDVVTATIEKVDAILFTGVVPYVIATNAGGVTKPAMYVPYSGATLLRALVELLRLGHDVTRMSIDTLRQDEVMETLTEAKLPTEHIHVMPYRPGITSRELVEFHRSMRGQDDTRIAITCLGSAFHQLDNELHAVRLAPSRHSIRSTLQALILTTAGQYIGDAQLTLGLIQLPADDPRLADDLVVLGGSLSYLPDGQPLVVTTRGLLEDATEQYTRLPLLDQLKARHGSVNIGFGVGRTAAEAESLARRAANRATAIGGSAAVVSMTGDVDIVMEPGHEAAPHGDHSQTSLPVLARRVGLTVDTLGRLRELARMPPGENGAGHEGLTSREVAAYLSVQERTARRALKRLERAGLALPVGSRQPGPGRPSTVYRLLL